MPYVHLADGTVRKMDADAMNEAFGDEPPTALVEKGKEHIVIGVYPDEVEVKQDSPPEGKKEK